ncbi:hypothetical protein OAT18_03480, partial [Tenacibaculum sp.]|nr:hypothetical protein [Tenacibaculum sp.]
VKDYKRKITHNNYKNSEKLKKYYHGVKKKIFVKPNRFDKNYTEKKYTDYIFFNNQFLVTKTGNWIVPILGGGISFAFFLVFIWPSNEPLNGADEFFMILTLLLIIFFSIYGFTMPKKEHILNRQDGLITFTGFFWQKNITMVFNNVEFAYSTGGENGIGAFQLQIIRPNKWQTFATAGYVGSECYENMSFITWYMDKNRPLPPGEVFDAFRQVDYELRKAEGFPKPLYPSTIKTPEATKEQQAERKRIGGW